MILGIETATRFGGVALIDEGRLIGEYRLSLSLSHAERLLPLVDTLFSETRRTLSSVHAIAVSIGPGSFTGLRVGLATAKGLAIGCRIPLLSVPTLEAFAAPFRSGSLLIAPMIVARRETVYWALFAPNGEAIIRLCPDSVSQIDAALDQIDREQKKILFAGDGAVAFADWISKRLPDRFLMAPFSLQYPLPSSVAELGLSLWERGETTAPENLLPRYLSLFEPKTSRAQGRQEKRCLE